MYRIRPYHKLLRNKSNDTGCFLNQLHNLFPCILVGFSQFFFRVVVRDVFQTEHPDREIFTPQLFPVGDLFIKDILICIGVSSLTLLSLFSASTYPSSITLLLNRPNASVKRKSTISRIVILVTKPLQVNIPSIILSKTFFIPFDFHDAKKRSKLLRRCEYGLKELFQTCYVSVTRQDAARFETGM